MGGVVGHSCRGRFVSATTRPLGANRLAGSCDHGHRSYVGVADEGIGHRLLLDSPNVNARVNYGLDESGCCTAADSTGRGYTGTSTRSRNPPAFRPWYFRTTP